MSSCLPSSGGCERARTDPFVRHLNVTEGCNYEHVLCLDRVFRDSPQPEALYIDERTGQRLVVERKSLVWPLDHVKTHQNDHLVAEWLFSALSEALRDGPYTIILPPNIRGSRANLRQFAKSIADAVLDRFDDLRAGQVLRGGSGSERWAAAREGPNAAFWSMRDSQGAPQNGLVIQWFPTDDMHLEFPDALVSEISRHLGSCAQKFQPYPDDRRVLVVEPFGELRYQPDSWWHQAFKLAGLPAEITEVWQGVHDWITESDQGWLFDKLHPANSRETV